MTDDPETPNAGQPRGGERGTPAPGPNGSCPAVARSADATAHDPADTRVKTFVIDTNVLLHNPNALFLFAENDVVIPFDVIEELDKFKAGTDDLGATPAPPSATWTRCASRGDLSAGVSVEQTGGRVRVILEEDQKLCAGLTANTPDNRIICCALTLHRQGERVVFISKDINARIKADALRLVAEDFEAQKVDFDKLYTGYREAIVPGKVIDALFNEKQARIDAPDLLANEFVLLKDQADPAHTALARYRSDVGALVPVRNRRGPVFGILPRNLQQTMALDLLLDDSVKLVSLIGNAGTGKTLLAIAAGMTKTLNEQIYQKLLCARPIMPLGRDIGYLPGDKDQKLNAWMQPIFDNMAYLLSNRLTSDAEHKPHASLSSVEQRIQQLMESGQVVLEPLTYIRGRSIPHQFMIVDESQNLTPHEVKTIASRVGEGTKLVLTGDATQIDNPYLDSSSNGLSYLVERLKGKGIVGHVTLDKSERSELASLVTAEL